MVNAGAADGAGAGTGTGAGAGACASAPQANASKKPAARTVESERISTEKAFLSENVPGTKLSASIPGISIPHYSA
jgi:hypothetical protein